MHWYLVPIDPPNSAHLYRALLHQDSMTYYRMHCYVVPIDTPTNWAHLYRALQHQDSMCRSIPPANWAHLYSALLHQNSITY